MNDIKPWVPGTRTALSTLAKYIKTFDGFSTELPGFAQDDAYSIIRYNVNIPEHLETYQLEWGTNLEWGANNKTDLVLYFNIDTDNDPEYEEGDDWQDLIEIWTLEDYEGMSLKDIAQKVVDKIISYYEAN